MSEEKEIFDKQFVYLEWDDVLKGKKVFVADTLPQLRDFVGRNYNSLPTVSENVCDDTYYPFIASSGMQYAMCYYDPNYECKVAYAQGKTIQARTKGSTRNEWINMEHPGWLDTYEYRVKLEPEMWTACFNDDGVISVMPASDWNKSKGRQLIEGTNEECQRYVVETYCNKCACGASCVGHKCTMNLDMWYCQGFRELKAVKKRRWTNRELAKWLADNNGQVMYTSSKFKCTEYSYTTDDDDQVHSTVQIRGWDETEWHEPEVEE